MGWKEKGQTEYVSKDAEYQFKVTKNIELTGEFKAVEVPHIPSAQEILDDILANHKIPSEVKAGTETLVLPEVPEGSKIEIVAVNPEGIIGLDGKVTTPENDTDVIVTIQVTDTNGATAKADVKVLVRGEKADPNPDPNPNPDPVRTTITTEMITMVETTIQETTVEAATAEVITMEVHPVLTLRVCRQETMPM